MTDDIEILVHISAPATRQNDELYHSVADAYLKFEPHRIIQSQPRQRQHGLDRPTDVEINSIVALTKNTPTQAAPDISVLSTSKDSYGSFPSYISSDDQAKIQELASIQQRGSSENDSLPPSSRLAQLERIHTKWKQQKPPNSSHLGERNRNRELPNGSDGADTAFIEDTQLAVQALQSQLQVSFSTTSEDTSEDESEPESSTEQQRPSTTKNSQQTNDRSTLNIPASSSTSTFARSEIVFEDHGGNATPDDSMLISIASNRTKEIKEVSLVDQIKNSGPLDFATVPADAYPPAPEVSVAASGVLPSQITRYLASIIAQNPKRFKPSKKLRAPKPDDRGYWKFKCSEWSNELQLEFWTTLYDHVASGRLGWGTTLHRESPSPRSLGPIKLYCWGEVVEHMWLVLWLCSKGKVSGSASKWIDADGIAILEVL